jgi:hypothetical protein
LLASRLAVRERAISAPLITDPPTVQGSGAGPAQEAAPRSHRGSVAGAALVAAALVAAAIVFVAVTRMRAGYDAYGWLVWGRQTLHWNLDTNGAPSWKPLTFLFTLPYAPAGRAQPWLWMVTAVSLTLAGSVFAARIAYRLTGPSPARPYAPIVAAAFAALSLLALDDYSHQVLIATSDTVDVALCLAAIDCHLSRRPRLAFLMLILASLGRPEAWPFAGLYAVWLWRAIPSMRLAAVVGIAAIPMLWFGISALTAKTWFRAGDLALNSVNVLHGDKFTGVLGRLAGLYTLPMQIAVGLALVLAAALRERVWLLLAGSAFAWVAIEIALALHGWSAVPRYLFEPAAVLLVLAGAAVGRALAFGHKGRPVLRWVGTAAVLVLVAALIPTAVHRGRELRSEIVLGRQTDIQIRRLEGVIARVGGAARIRACGQPVTLVGWQSTIAWETGLNVGNVGYKPGRSIQRGDPIVLLKPHDKGWQMRPIHTAAPDRARCAALRTDSPLG